MANRMTSLIGKIVIRLYAMVILLVVLWTGYTAIAYLFTSVFTPARLPSRFVDWPGKLEADALQAANATGILQPAPRAPLGHYHAVDKWFQPDPHNGCITSGCHNPLPHTKSVEVRAFANFHATFLECCMCHEEPASSPMQAMWVNTGTGLPQPAPALVQLLNTLETQSEEIRTDPAAVHGTIVRLLADAMTIIGRDPILQHLALVLEASQPGSPVWNQAIEQLGIELPRHARGEYGAKLAPYAAGEIRQRMAGGMADLTAQYLAAPKESDQRKQLSERIHQGLVAKPGACLACHGQTPPRLDYAALGYSPARSAALLNIPVAAQMQGIREGRPFYLPRLGEQ